MKTVCQYLAAEKSGACSSSCLLTFVPQYITLFEMPFSQNFHVIDIHRYPYSNDYKEKRNQDIQTRFFARYSLFSCLIDESIISKMGFATYVALSRAVSHMFPFFCIENQTNMDPIAVTHTQTDELIPEDTPPPPPLKEKAGV